ncbi:MAG: glycoside hydrolase family 97 protein [Muribaculaceae bacterium]|nr:glycoside hydrolase family 97 protein [Muribaculaceae bacterium]
MKRLFIAAIAIVASLACGAKEYRVSSPDGNIRFNVSVAGSTEYSIDFKNNPVVLPTEIGMQLTDGRVVGRGKVTSVARRSVDSEVAVVVGKNNSIPERYNELLLTFDRGAYTLSMRAYNEGVAFKWDTYLADSIYIADEMFRTRFKESPEVWFPECDRNTYMQKEATSDRRFPVHEGYRNFERLHRHYDTLADIDSIAFSVGPTLFRTPEGVNVVMTEANVYDYPGLYIRKHDALSPRGMWAGYPRHYLDEDRSVPGTWYSQHLVYEREDYIAHTAGTRTYPWRVLVVSDDDASLLNNELVYLLADPCEIEDTSWIVAGRSAWEWWHKAVVEGVDFPVGNRHLSKELYKYYIDWAADNGIEYMTLDAGWSESYIRELCDYGRERGVGIIVWTWSACAVGAPFDWIKKMKDYGVSGAKIDFFERNDQVAMTWMRQLAKRLADEQMVVNFHGCPTPNGLNRTYPNVLNFEAVRGAECNFWEKTLTAEHHVTFPFIRSLAGPQDYTPGSMRSVPMEQFKPQDIDSVPPMSMCTRAHEMALFVVFDQWLATLCDAPSEYNKSPEIVSYLSAVPSTWDETRPIEGSIGENIVIAKRKGEEWWIGALTNDEARTLDVDLSFLPEGRYRAVWLADSPASSVDPKRTLSFETIVNITAPSSTDEESVELFCKQCAAAMGSSRLHFDLAPSGGAVIRLIPMDAFQLITY